MTDALIVGGGPAGATAAILLARQGARAMLVDKARFPRDKLCGEFVSPEAVRILAKAGVLDRFRATAGRAQEVLLTGPSGQSVRLPVPVLAGAGREALGIPRQAMDAALLEEAGRRGVTILEGFEVRQLAFSQGRVTGVLGRERGASSERALRATFVLAADGRDSTIARFLDPRRLRRQASPRFGIKAHYRCLRGLGGAVELHYFAGGYVGLHEVGRDRVNVCALIDRSVAGTLPRDPERIVTELFFRNPAARARLETAERVSDWLAVGSLVFRSEAPARSGVLFLGDAAGTIDPFAGEGLSMAFRSAEIAAEQIGRALGGSLGGALPSPESVPGAYSRRWRKEFASRIAICRAIGRLAIRPRFQGPMFGLLERVPAAGRVLALGTRKGLH